MNRCVTIPPGVIINPPAVALIFSLTVNICSWDLWVWLTIQLAQAFSYHNLQWWHKEVLKIWNILELHRRKLPHKLPAFVFGILHEYWSFSDISVLFRTLSVMSRMRRCSKDHACNLFKNSLFEIFLILNKIIELWQSVLKVRVRFQIYFI